MKKPYQQHQPINLGVVRCLDCRGPHYKKDCPKLSGKKVDMKICFSCNKSGRIYYDCPKKKKREVGRQQSSSFRVKSKATGKVFAITGEEATEPGNFILDTCFLFGTCERVLFDYGATYHLRAWKNSYYL